VQRDAVEDLDLRSAADDQALDEIEAVEFPPRRATSGRYLPGGGGGRRTRGRPSSTPRRRSLR
jgi:hypothetical protein